MKEPNCPKCKIPMFLLGDFKEQHFECETCGHIIVPIGSDRLQVVAYQLRESNRNETQLRVLVGIWNAGQIPRNSTPKGDRIEVQLSELYLFGTERLKQDMSENELEEWMATTGIRTLPDSEVALEPVMTMDQCREIFRTGLYPVELGESLGFVMR